MITEKMINEVKEKYKETYIKSEREIKSINLVELYDKYNKKYFYNQLPHSSEVQLKWSKRMTRIAGKCTTGHNKKIIKLSVYYHMKRPHEIENVLVHEMIHLLAHDHGTHFKTIMNKVNHIAGRKLVTIHSAERSKIKYVALCPRHGEVATRSRKPKYMEGWTCGYCGESIKFIKVAD